VQILWGIDISRRARIGPGFYIGHFGGIFVHSDAVLGARCSLSQCVSIGIGGNGGRRGVPLLGNDIYLAPGARLFGPIRIGDRAKIGANAVVHQDVPADAVVTLESSVRITRPIMQGLCRFTSNTSTRSS
jgi:serine O-acetyltransferase